MKTVFALALCALVLAAANPADACSRRRNNNNRGRRGNVVITPRNPPLTNPPTPNPTPPPPPPPLPTGWVPPPPRPPAQEMTRTNCNARVEFHIVVDNANSATASSVDRSQVQESWVYECKFQVYVEVDVAKVEAPTNCACGMVYQRHHPSEDPNYEKAYSTEITQFSMVAFDTAQNAVVGVFPPETFDRLRPNANTTALLRNSASSNSQDYELTAHAYSGLIQNLGADKFPKALDPQSAEYNINNVPAMCFTVVEKYVTSYKWPQPPYPHMQTSPNVWVTKCYPYYDYAGQSAKRQNSLYAKQKYWFKEFLLFPIKGNQDLAAWSPKARYITSFYRNSNCDVGTGVVSFDREFESEFARESKFRLHGAFAWKRKYVGLHVVGGVPIKFSSPLSFYVQGYTRITWKESYGRDSETGAFRKGVVAHALLGTPQTGDAPFIGASADLKLCEAVPSAWKTCDPSAGCADLRAKEYNEGAFSYRVDLSSTAEVFNCAPAVYLCPDETTFMSFQNYGVLARDYSKRANSVLLTGPRSQFCIDYPTRGVFDALYFSPYKFGGNMQLRKRDALQDGVDKVTQMLAFNDDGEVVGLPESTDMPEASDVLIQPAAGSADENGRAGGDHPIDLFPEVYTVPVTLNPGDSSYDGATASVYNGKLVACLEGSQGCSCRTNPNRPKCDAPLECNTEAYCEVPLCVPGQAGCPCTLDKQCSDSTLQCNTDSMCVFQSTCAAGASGCACKADATCDSADAMCSADNVCVAKSECTAGESGCACSDNGACSSDGDVCNELTFICESPTCESGASGCACADGDRCQAGFMCKSEACVQRLCPEGEAGCACAGGKTCNHEGFECLAFKTDGTDNRCVAKGVECGDQAERCVEFCGEGRVVKCPACANQVPVCDGAAALAPSALIALAIAAIALLF